MLLKLACFLLLSVSINVFSQSYDIQPSVAPLNVVNTMANDVTSQVPYLQGKLETNFPFLSIRNLVMPKTTYPNYQFISTDLGGYNFKIQVTGVQTSANGPFTPANMTYTFNPNKQLISVSYPDKNNNTITLTNTDGMDLSNTGTDYTFNQINVADSNNTPIVNTQFSGAQSSSNTPLSIGEGIPGQTNLLSPITYVPINDLPW